MTFKIRKITRPHVVFKLIGYIAAEHLSELRKLMTSESNGVVLDLAELKLVDRDAVDFLVQSESNGIKIINCPAYIREWILRESTKGGAL